MGQRRQRIVDILLDVWSTHATVQAGDGVSGSRSLAGMTGAATPLYVDTGGGFTEGYIVVDISDTVQDVAASQFFANVFLMGSTTALFPTQVPLALLSFGGSIVQPHPSKHSVTSKLAAGRYMAPFCNDFGGVLYRYLRMYCVTGGSNNTGILFNGFLTR